MPEIHGVASWPGAIAVEGCSAIVSHGITPGVALLKMQPQPAPPAMEGDLVLFDGVTTVTLPASKVERLDIVDDGNGFVWHLLIRDRRWRWTDLGFINGRYNQLDWHAKLIPWTIRNPVELATLCLDAMGEVGYTIDLPAGLPAAVGANIQTMLPSGINYPQIAGGNPPVEWRCLPPAVVLQALCEQYGRRVVYRLSTNTVAIVPLGEGDDLPPGSIYRAGPSMKNPDTPDAVGVMGSPTRYQMRLALVAVGLDYDDVIRPIDQLSYAPRAPGKKQVSTFAITGPVDSDFTHTVTVIVNGVSFVFQVQPGDTAADAITGQAAQINNYPAFNGVLTASAAGAVLTITGIVDGVEFTVAVGPDTFPDGTFTTAKLIQAAELGRPSWRYCPPPTFPDIQATPQLTAQQARELAQRTVFRWYQVSDTDVSGTGPIQVPGYGTLKRRQQLILLDTQVDQVVPLPADRNILARNAETQNQPVVVDMYLGYSRDRPARVFGSVYSGVFNDAGIIYPGADPNTPEGLPLLVPFELDPEKQLVLFGPFMYKATPDGIVEPSLVLQTAVNVLDPNTNYPVSYTEFRRLPSQNSQTNPKMKYCPDIQLNVTSTYTDANPTPGGVPPNKILSVSILEADPIVRADYYLNGLAAQYFLSGGLTLEYNGLMAIDLDGARQQVTWNIDRNGVSTVASYNTEHEVRIQPYPARRRAEALPAARQEDSRAAALRNLFWFDV